MAGDFCKAGKVRINDEKVKPAKKIQVGDMVTVDFKDFLKRYKVLDFVEKRVSAERAALCYEDCSPEKPKRDFFLNPGEVHQGVREKGAGRPTKKERRDLDRVWGIE